MKKPFNALSIAFSRQTHRMVATLIIALLAAGSNIFDASAAMGYANGAASGAAAVGNADGAASGAQDAAATDSVEVVDYFPLPISLQLPMVFDSYNLKMGTADTLDINAEPLSANWADRAALQADRAARFLQQFMLANPGMVRYNMEWLPKPPKEAQPIEVDPSLAKVTVADAHKDVGKGLKELGSVELKRINWLHNANASLQFSQAYISPNWYQGGNNNLNMLANAIWNVKLNPAYHPNLMFETTVQYKLGLYSTPEDTIRSYAISEELFQVNTTFGVRAAKRWFYSVNVQFKTQFFNNYKTNTHTLMASLLSPGELNLGLGMTYNYANPRKTVQFDAALSPLSYNLKTCIDRDMNETQFGIEKGRTTVSNYGSSAEATLKWQLTANISLRSRLFAFTDYDYIQGDWENTFNFEINRFLSTQLYLHLRYDSSTPYHPDMDWQKWQFKEILSFGFAYKFATI